MPYLVPQMSLAARSGQFWSLQGSAGAGGGLPKDGNGAKGDVVGGRFAGDHVEKDSPPGSNVGKPGPSPSELISVGPPPPPRAAQPEGMYRHAGGCYNCSMSVRTYVCSLLCICLLCVVHIILLPNSIIHMYSLWHC